MQIKIKLAALSPTCLVAKHHWHRAYFTVLEWPERRLDPLAWGWNMETNLTPVVNECPVAPDSLLNLISCSCKTNGCTATCGCEKLGVYCSSLCSKCEGASCNNAAPMSTLLVHGDQDKSDWVFENFEICFADIMVFFFINVVYKLFQKSFIYNCVLSITFICTVNKQMWPVTTLKSIKCLVNSMSLPYLKVFYKMLNVKLYERN